MPFHHASSRRLIPLCLSEDEKGSGASVLLLLERYHAMHIVDAQALTRRRRQPLLALSRHVCLPRMPPLWLADCLLEFASGERQFKFTRAHYLHDPPPSARGTLLVGILLLLLLLLPESCFIMS